jgi:hypothetical protein
VPAAKYTKAQRDEALALYHTHGPTAVQTQLGIPKATVTGWAKANGVRTVRTERTREATEARAVDLKASRQELAALLLADAHRLRAQMWEPTVAFAFGGKDNTYAEQEIPEPTFVDKKNILGAVGIAVDRVVKLNAVDESPADSAAAAGSVVDKLMEGFTAIYQAGQ